MKSAVLGMGIEGKDLVNYLISRGDSITVLDQKPQTELDLIGIDTSKVSFQCGPGYLSNLTDFEVIYRSAGIYPYKPELIEASKQGVEVSSAIKLFFKLCPGKIIGVTGTKGKGTTSTLIYQSLINSRADAYLAGNIGKPYLELLPKLKPNSIVVLEMSSFQLIDMDVSPYIGVVLNITTDHMDWHKDRNEYINAKRNIVSHQNPTDYAVINEEYEDSRNFVDVAKGKVVFFSKKSLDEKFKIGLLLRGEHNLENIAAAVTVARIMKIDEKVIEETVKTFKGLEHRLELAGRVNGIEFYNDSFSTGPQPTIAAIKSFTEPLTLIAGGSDKGLDYTRMGQEIANSQNVINVCLIGDMAEKIKEALVKANYKGKILELGRNPMTAIVEECFKNTPKGGIVLLSPAAASFDMFANYKDRGNQFKEAIGELTG